MQRKFRLTGSADIERVRRDGKAYAHPLLVLIVSPGTGEGPRAAIIAGRGVGNAVQRNRAKRRLRAALQPRLARLTGAYDLALIARAASLTHSFEDLCRAVDGCLKRAGLLENEP